MYQILKKSLITALLTAAVVSGLAGTSAAAEEVNLYSYRQPFLIEPLLKRFTRDTGIEVNMVFAKSGILERLKAEGRNASADAVLTADIGRLNDIVKAGVLGAVASPVLTHNIPPQYRHPEGLWFGLTRRARVIIASRDRIGPGEVVSYENLADPKLRNRVCVRSGKHPYNISLIASVITHKGLDQTRVWLNGVKSNLARKPQGNDRAQARAIKEGLCDVALINTYYMGKMATNDKEPEQKTWAKAVRVIFPNADGRGTHVNVSGAGVVKWAKNRENAVRLLEFLSSDWAQEAYARTNYEYPVKPGVTLHPLVRSWGELKADASNLVEIAKHRSEASRLVDEVAFNQE
jgi:iron(III) transport system substrate-binding protein